MIFTYQAETRDCSVIGLKLFGFIMKMNTGRESTSDLCPCAQIIYHIQFTKILSFPYKNLTKIIMGPHLQSVNISEHYLFC